MASSIYLLKLVMFHGDVKSPGGKITTKSPGDKSAPHPAWLGSGRTDAVSVRKRLVGLNPISRAQRTILARCLNTTEGLSSHNINESMGLTYGRYLQFRILEWPLIIYPLVI